MAEDRFGEELRASCASAAAVFDFYCAAVVVLSGGVDVASVVAGPALQFACGCVCVDAEVFRDIWGGGECVAAADGGGDFDLLAFGAEGSVGFFAEVVCGDVWGVAGVGDPDICDWAGGDAARSGGGG